MLGVVRTLCWADREQPSTVPGDHCFINHWSPGVQTHTTEAGECAYWGTEAWGWGAAEIKLAAAGKSEGREGLPDDSSAS